MTRGVKLSSMTPLSDVKAYFAGRRWDGHWSGDSFEGSVGIVDVKIKAVGKSYAVSIESVDDPTDSEEISTSEPLKAIADFLGQDIPGGEHFERMSSIPSFFAHSVAMAAELVGAGAIGRRAAIRMLRRFSSIRMAESAPRRPGADLSDLEADSKRKGWKTKLKKDDHGDDVLEIDVSGIFEAEVTLDSLVYEYKFELRGQSQVDESGTTDDPIREFEKWVRSPKVEEAMEGAKESERKLMDNATRPADPEPARETTHRRRPPAMRRPMEEPLS